MIVAFFDFDETLVKKDSLPAFLNYYFSKPKLLLKTLLFSPNYLLYKLKIINGSEAKERLFHCFFKGEDASFFQRKTEAFSQNWIQKNINAIAFKKLQWHLQNKHQVYIVSASISNYLVPWADQHQVQVISTELEVEDGGLTGKFSTLNCSGIEKVKRIKEKVDCNKITKSYAYGDSDGDLEMLAFVDESFHRTF